MHVTNDDEHYKTSRRRFHLFTASQFDSLRLITGNIAIPLLGIKKIFISSSASQFPFLIIEDCV